MKDDAIKDRICENLVVLREYRNLTQGDLAKILGSTQKSISSYERKRAFPKLDLLNAYLEYFNISYRDLSQLDLSTLRPDELERLLSKKQNSAKILAITVDNEDNENIELVPVKAAAGYAEGLGDPEYLKQLPRFRLPFLPAGTYRAFEIEGTSMLPVQPGSVVVGKFVEQPNDIKKGDPYILVMEDGVVFKRVFHSPYEQHEDNFLLVSDNPSYEPFEVEIANVQQIWQAYKIISDVS